MQFWLNIRQFGSCVEEEEETKKSDHRSDRIRSWILDSGSELLSFPVAVVVQGGCGDSPSYF